MEQKTLHHCSANTLTVGDLGPGLPRSVRGGTGAREVRERLHRHPSTILPECLHPWLLSTTPIPSIDPLFSLDKHDKSCVYLLKKTRRKSKRGADKKLYKINTELVVPALLLLFLV